MKISKLNNFCQDDRLAKRVPLRPLSSDVSSKESFDIISTWLQQCLSKHKNCQNRDEINQKLPTRVIDVQHEGQDPFLVETNQRNGNWVALSYCWGSSPTAVTTRQNLQQHCNKIPMSSLPQTMKDAIVVARRLGYRYLWIDSLCIIQDSPEDWAVESLKMADVYGGASLTIAAGAGIDTASGIFDSTNVFRQQQCGKFNFSIEGYDPHHPEERGRPHVMNSIDLDPYTFSGCLSKRAWTLQENLMSRRLITFGKEQLYWRCVTQDFIEACPTREFTQRNHNHTDFIRRNMNEKKTELSWWYDIVNDYIHRHITMQKDVLIGISAIAKVMAEEMRQSPTAYKAGLWEHDFHKGLLWRRPYHSRLPLIRHTEYIAPSWSWASVSASHMSSPRIYDDDDISLSEYDEEHDDYTPPSDAKIIAINIKNENDDHFGIVQGGYVKLSGRTLEICRHEIPSVFLDCPENAKDEISKFYDQVHGYSIFEANLIANGCKDSHPKALLISISTFPKGTMNVLILQSTESLDVYQRVGCLSFVAFDGNLQHPDWTTREITII
ncbi:uncharacterized protein EAF02_008759 [Botrytis sinoallii]|uniref:uncharacterized protein n=1 Tax=Botrytis sinoallii TaxID=1463999 RepID=UPI0019009091|nr:uncharacterized protein EAF02_008759 [Botrytis sinoallii]KAF7872688.1 hypothetical protein EAF02_008759 [Botrytis sinoallii]